MAKKVLEITDFTGGLNCYKDARDIKDNEFAQNWNANISQSGLIKPGGTLFESIRNLPHNNSNQESGYGLFTTGVDYSLSIIDGEFENAFEQGTFQTAYDDEDTNECLRNGNFGDTSDWAETGDFTLANPVTYSHLTGAGYLYQDSSTGSGYASGNAPTAAKMHKLTFTIASVVNASRITSVTLKGGDGYLAQEDVELFATSTNNIANGTYDVLFLSWESFVAADDFRIDVVSSDSCSFSIDDVSIKQINGVHLSATSTHVSFTNHETDDYYNNYCILVDSGTGAGQVRRIVDYTGATKVGLLDSTFGTNPGASSTYKIFRWVGDGVQFGCSASNFALGGGTNYIDNAGASSISGDDINNFNADNDTGYFLRTTASAIADNQSKELGFITYNPKTSSAFTACDEDSTVTGATTLKSGVEYTLSFWCNTTNRYYGYVSNGAGVLTSTGVARNGGTLSAVATTVTVAVDTVAATAGVLLNKNVYDSSGVSIGVCTAVNSTTEIVFGNGISIDIEDGDVLYTYPTGIISTGVVSNESTESASTSAVTLTVDTTSATDALLLDRKVYKADGTFIGICTSVTDTTHIVFGSGTAADIEDNTTLYTEGHGERVPFVQLYSNTVTDGTNTGLHLFQGKNGPELIPGVDSTFNYQDNITANYVDNGDFEDGTATGGDGGYSSTYDPPTGWTAFDGLAHHTNNTITYSYATPSFTDATCDTANTDATVACDASKLIHVGQAVSGTGIPAGATVASVTGGDGIAVTSFELSGAATATNTNETLTFTETIFGAEGNTLNMVSGSAFDWLTSPDGKVPNCFMYQELTLNDNQWYELFFAYSSTSNGLTYALIDASDLTSTGVVINNGSGYAVDDDSVTVAVDDGSGSGIATDALLKNRMLFNVHGNFVGIVSAVGSTTAITFGGGLSGALVDNDVLYYANTITDWETATDTGGITTYKYIGEVDSKSVPKPHKFRVPASSTAGVDRKILLCFAPVKVSINVRLDGITVRKSFPDLISMSNDIFGNVHESIGWANYQTRFRISPNYNDATDWVLRLNAGSHGYQASATIDSTASTNSHTVYFGDIRLEGRENDNLLFLNDNTSSKSKIDIYSYNSENWIENDLIWSGLNMKPVYNYINGILKISDANFESGNISKIFYYLNRKQLGGHYNITGYRTRDLPLSLPPPLIVASSADSQGVVQKFDVLNYLNEYTFGASFVEYYGEGQTATTWPAGKLDTMGKILYYQRAENQEISTYKEEHQLKVGTTDSQLTELDDSEGGHWNQFFYLPWAGDDGSANDMTSAMTSYTSGDLKRIEMTFTYEFCATNWAKVDGGNYTGATALKNLRHPQIEVFVAKMANDPFGGSTINDTNRKLIMVRDADATAGVSGTWYGTQTGGTDGGEIYVNDEVWDAYYDENNNIAWESSTRWAFNEVETGAASSHSEGIRYGSKEFKAVINIEEGKIAIGDTPMIKIRMQYPTASIDNGDFHMFHCVKANEDRDHNEWYFARKERIIFHNIDAYFYDNNYANTDEGVTQANVNDTKVTFKFGTPSGQTGVGWEERIFKIGVSSTNIFDEESNISSSSVSVGTAISTGVQTDISSITSGQCPDVSVYIGQNVAQDKFRKKLKFYMKDTESNIWYLQFYVDLDENKIYSTTSNYSSSGLKDTVNRCYSYTIPKEKILNYNEVDSYESQTLISQDIAEKSIQEFICDYKASVVANNRLYVGNIRQNDKIYGDRMIKSPIGKYNILPSTNFIDVAINDGDEIVALEYFKDKLLQFKKNKVFIINTSGDYEFLEETYEDIGVLLPCQVTKTPYGIVWINSRGCFMYDGTKMENLIDKKIPNRPEDSIVANNFWNFEFAAGSTSTTELSKEKKYYKSGILGYNASTKDIIIRAFLGSASNNTIGAAITSVPDGYVYNIPTKSWYFTQKSFNGHWKDTNSGVASNFVTDKDGSLITYVRNTGISGHGLNDILKWNSSAANDESIVKQRGITAAYANMRAFYFVTKDFTFGDITRRKKIYKVYVTFKSTDSSGAAAHSKILVKHAINGGSTFTAFDDSSTNYSAANGLSDGASSTDWITAILVPSSSINNIYTFQLQFVSILGFAVQFKINDISIVYRDKPIK